VRSLEVYKSDISGMKLEYVRDFDGLIPTGQPHNSFHLQVLSDNVVFILQKLDDRLILYSCTESTTLTTCKEFKDERVRRLLGFPIFSEADKVFKCVFEDNNMPSKEITPANFQFGLKLRLS
jgi:hypothetical protein